MSFQESTSEGNGASVSSNSECTPSTSLRSNDRMKRAAAKQQIERYYYQLIEGCGRENCENDNCSSSLGFLYKNITNNEAAVKAIDLFKSHAELCEGQPLKVAKSAAATGEPNVSTSSTGAPAVINENEDTCASGDQGSRDCSQEPMDCVSSPQSTSLEMGISGNSACQTVTVVDDMSKSSGQSMLARALSQLAPVSKSETVSKPNTSKEDIPYLTEVKLHDIIEQCKEDDKPNWSLLKNTLFSVFENSKSLMQSFRRKLSPPSSKEELRSMEVDLDKDIDDRLSSSSRAEESKVTVKDNEHSLDLESLRRSYKELFAIPELPFQDVLVNALIYLSKNLELEMKYQSPYEKDPNYLNIFLIILEIPVLFNVEFIEMATPNFLKTVSSLPVTAQAKLTRLWSNFSKDWMKDMLHGLQQLITVKCITSEFSRSYVVNDNTDITGAVKVMKILYYASLLGGKIDSPERIEAEKTFIAETDSALNELYQGAMSREQKEKPVPKLDPLEKELGVDSFNCRRPVIDWIDFVNEPLSDIIEMDKDYTYYKAESPGKFTFMTHSFILSTAVKSLGLYYDNRIRMIEERRSSILQSFLNGGLHMPYLKLRIRRDHIIDDALVNLEMAAMDNPQDLKKQLYVEFEGEQGIDEGGVSKEFFQLVVEEIFNPNIGMFAYSKETKSCWFNPLSFENDGQFTLIGIVLGLAIYNNVILDIHFPMVVYRKLLGKMGTVEDLTDSHPVLARSLVDLLEYEGDVEETFLQSFHISYQDIFGNIITEDLKPEGSTIMVNNDNRKEFVDLYADFLLNKSIEKQFKAFYRGFHMVTDESPLKMLFRPEEIELLVCGSKHFDFRALEDSTEYDGGFSAESTVIRNFWDVVHSFNEDQKRKLLQFTTGSDRIPVGGLSKLKLVIARNGPDSERLPTAHTCFNVLLLPDYNSKEKLQERLVKAISYAKGFGML